MKIQPLKQAFGQLGKQQIFRQSHLFFEVNQAVQNFFSANTITNAAFQVTIKESVDTVSISVSVSNKTLLTWLKTEHEDFLQSVQNYLQKRQCISNTQTVTIILRS